MNDRSNHDMYNDSYRSAAWLLLSIGMACCGGEDTPQSEVFENVGAICLTRVGAEIRIDADFELCLSGCHHASSARCQGSFEDGRIVVTSRGEFVNNGPPGRNCPDNCVSAKAVCVFTAPVAGEVPVVYGDEEASVRLPLARATPLFGGDPCSRK
jgi:hypothetical protein